MSSVDKKNEILMYVLITTYISFALALANFSFISNFFEIFRWVVFFIYIFLTLYIFKFRVVSKVGLSFIFYTLFLLILTISTFWFSGLSVDSIASLFPFLIILIFPFLPYPTSYGNRTDYFVMAYKKFSVLFIISILPFLLIPDSYIMGRFAAWTKNTNIVAGFAMLSYSIFFISYIKNKNRYDLIGVVSYLLIVFLTQSRGALIAIVIITGIMLLKNYNKKIFFQVGFVVLILGVIVLSNIQIREIGNNDTNNSIFTVREFELGARQEIMDRQLSAFSYSPLIGVGALTEENNPHSRYPAEASFTDLLSMVGIFGFIFYLLSIVCRLRSFNDNDFLLLSILTLSFGEGYLTGIGSVISIIAYTILLSER